MGRKRTMMEQYKQQMKAYRKKKMKKDNTPYLPPDEKIYVMNSLNPMKKMEAEVLKTCTKKYSLWTRFADMSITWTRYFDRASNNSLVTLPNN